MVRSCPFVSGNEENAAERFALFDLLSLCVGHMLHLDQTVHSSARKCFQFGT